MRKIWSKLTKIWSKMCIKTAELRLIFTKIKSSITPYKKQKLKKSFYFHILRWTGFLMMPLTTLYDFYVDRQKLSEQKNPFEYIVPPSLKGGWNNESKIVYFGFRGNTI